MSLAAKVSLVEPQDIEYEARGLSRRGLVAATLGATAMFVLSSPARAMAADLPFPMYDPWAGVGMWRDWSEHNNTGLDIKQGQGKPVKAPFAGTVSTTWDSAVGNQLRISKSGWTSVFLHLESFAVSSGSVAIGALVAASGGTEGMSSSGSLSTGAHLHWHLVNPQGVRVDPKLYVNQGSPTTPPVVPIHPGDEMTDIFYFAQTGATATTQGAKSPVTTVGLNSIWYQECVGAPLFKIAAHWDTIEFRAFGGARLNDNEATRFATTCQKIADLIDLRGEASAPMATMAPLRT